MVMVLGLKSNTNSNYFCNLIFICSFYTYMENQMKKTQITIYEDLIGKRINEINWVL